MKKLEVEIRRALPAEAGTRDPCRERLIAALLAEPGVLDAHLEEARRGAHDDEPRICIHFDPELLPPARVEALVRRAGDVLAASYDHLSVQVDGLRHERRAQLVESALDKLPGVLHARVAFGAARVEVELDPAVTDRAAVLAALADLGVRPRAAVPPQRRDHAEAEHEHGHEGNAELWSSLACGALTGAGWIASRFLDRPSIGQALFVAAYVFGARFALTDAVVALRARRFEIDFLMLVAAAGAAALGEWLDGALLLFLFTLGHALEGYAMRRAKGAIEALADLAPKTATRVRADGGEEEVPVESLAVGDRVLLKPHQRVPCDAIVAEGSGSVDQAPITGESVPVDKRAVANLEAALADPAAAAAEERVFTGSVNGPTPLRLVVTRATGDTVLARIVKMVSEAESQKSATQRFTERFERAFVPLILAVVVLLLAAPLVLDEPFATSFYRAMAVLVAASPCALAIATPSAVLAGVARAARGGVLVKGGAHLETLGLVRAIAFDKTGTLTEGKPRLTDVVPLGASDETQVLGIAVAVEQHSDHPLAKAVVEEGRRRGLRVDAIGAIAEPEAVVGFGFRARIGDESVAVGKPDLFRQDGSQLPAEVGAAVEKLESAGRTVVVVRRGDAFLGVLGIMDRPRAAAGAVLRELGSLGVERTIMLSGDHRRAAEAVAREIGVGEVRGDLLPEQKVAFVKQLVASNGCTAMVGDGVNDAPALAAASVGVAMGAVGSDVALETADVALMADDLRALPFAIGLGRAARRVIRQNLWMSLGMVAVLVPATISGWAGIGAAVALHEGSTVLVVANALRMLAYARPGGEVENER